MNFEKKEPEKFGKILGYILMYIVFTTILFFILRLLDKQQGGLNYLIVMAITLSLILIGKLLKLWLK